MSRETVITLQTIGALLVVSAFLMLFVPAENIWPWILMFTSVGVGLTIGPGLATHPAKKTSSAAQPGE